MLNLKSPRCAVARFFLVAALAVLFGSTVASSQSTVGTGSIQGTVKDQTGAALGDARVTITNRATSSAIHVTSSSAGTFSSGALLPGNYVVRVEAKGFKTTELPVVAQVGVVSSANVKLEVGNENQIIQVQGTEVAVNTEQATVQGVLTASQIDNLPVNGRNFLDLAQLEPGVQIQEGSTFDPTKNGFSSISFQGRFGRTARIEVDGVDISDETVGTTTQNIPASAIQEFNLSQSTLDLSTELTSSGAVNVTTRSGTNALHGQAFGFFRGNQTAAALPGPTAPPFQREQFGGRLGGYLIKDKLFWFIDGERSKQDLTAAEPFTSPFDSLGTTLVQPFREVQLDGRLDWQLHNNAHAFYRFNFDQNSQIRPFGSASSTQGFKNVNHTPSHTLGYDFSTGTYTHSIRFEYLKFRNGIVDGTGTIPAGVDNPIPGLGINIGAPVAGSCVLSGGGSYCGGPNLLAPQATIQSNHEIKYDGSRVFGAHIIRYGATFNHIQGGGLAAFFTYPQVGTTFATTGQSDPTSYPADWVFLGNGIGFSTSEKAFGYPGGGLGPDNRFEAYVGDGWKLQRHVTLTYGLHYVRDTGRVDSGLGPEPTFNDWGQGLGNRVRTPGTNFAPQFGFAWDMGGVGKTVIRGGAGLFFENSIWNNVLFDSPTRSKQGIFAYTPIVCEGGATVPFTWPTNPGGVGTPIAGGAGVVVAGNNQVQPTFCGDPIAAAGSQILALSDAFKGAAAANVGLQPNGNYIGTGLSAANANGFDVFDPSYRTPRSWQMNLGIERQIRPGTVFSADFIRNIGEHYLIAVDRNHSGATRSFNVNNALAARDFAQQNAMTVYHGSQNCPPGEGQANCMVTSLGLSGAQAAYSASGLDSNIATTGGAPCSYCAFPGTNPISGNQGVVGTLDMLEPIGRSVYDGLQVKLVQHVRKPWHFVKDSDFQISYSFSKFVSQVQDQDFINVATNNDNPLQFTGPNALDRKHQISFGGTFNLPFFAQLSVIGHFYSPLPQNLSLPEQTSGGEIFATDWLGAGLGSNGPPEPIPGTQIGQFMRGTGISQLESVISSYNIRYAGTLTPSGSRLVTGNILTNADMTTLNWVMPTLGNVAPDATGFPWLRSMDIRAAWPIKLRERITVEPTASIFNVFNFSNAFLPGNLPSASLFSGANGLLSPNAVGGVAGSGLTPYRASFQSGTYALGAPRQFEFGLTVSF